MDVAFGESPGSDKIKKATHGHHFSCLYILKEQNTPYYTI